MQILIFIFLISSTSFPYWGRYCRTSDERWNICKWGLLNFCFCSISNYILPPSIWILMTLVLTPHAFPKKLSNLLTLWLIDIVVCCKLKLLLLFQIYGKIFWSFQFLISNYAMSKTLLFFLSPYTFLKCWRCMFIVWYIALSIAVKEIINISLIIIAESF